VVAEHEAGRVDQDHAADPRAAEQRDLGRDPAADGVPAQALAPVADCDDPVERVGYATEVLLTGILARQSLVRAMIAASVTRPDVAATRPGHRFALIEHALAPLAGADPQTLTQLKQGLAVVMSAEALFVLTDLCGLSAPDAVASAVRTARSLTAAAIGTGSS